MNCYFIIFHNLVEPYGKEAITVEIFRDTYEVMKSVAEKKCRYAKDKRRCQPTFLVGETHTLSSTIDYPGHQRL